MVEGKEVRLEYDIQDRDTYGWRNGKMRGFMYTTGHYVDTHKKKGMREIPNPLILLVVPRGIEPLFSA